jgi:hypothetical protein
MATIPHGDSLLSQGTSITVAGGPKIDPVDSTPFTLDPATGARKNDTNPQYLAPFQSTPLPPGKPTGSIANPNLVLTEAKEPEDRQHGRSLCERGSRRRINGTPIAPPSTPNDIGGIVNVPFVIKNAYANSFSAIFWIETVEQSSSLSLLATAVYADSHLGFHWSQVAAHLGGDTSQAIGCLSKSVARLKAPKGVEKSRLDAPCQPRIHN